MMKLKHILNEQLDGTASILLLFDKLSKSPTFISTINELKNPTDKYNAIVKFAALLGITEGKLESFMTNMKQIKPNNEQS